MEVSQHQTEWETAEWPNCEVGGCENKACLRLESPYCHPHTMTRMIYTTGVLSRAVVEEIRQCWESEGEV